MLNFISKSFAAKLISDNFQTQKFTPDLKVCNDMLFADGDMIQGTMSHHTTAVM